MIPNLSSYKFKSGRASKQAKGHDKVVKSFEYFGSVFGDFCWWKPHNSFFFLSHLLTF